MFKSVKTLAISAIWPVLLGSTALAQPVVPTPAGAKPGQPKPAVPMSKPAPPQAAPGEIDWRGLDEDARRKQRASAGTIAPLVKNAPYRIEVASADANKISITNAFTLERRRLFEAPIVHAFAFSKDGAWLYAVHGKLPAKVEVSAVDVDTAEVLPFAALDLQSGEVIVDVLGDGALANFDVTLLIGTGPAANPSTCTTWSGQRRVRIRKDPAAKAAAKVEPRAGWPETTVPSNLGGTAPNTKYRISLANGSLVALGRFGGGDIKLNRSATPVGVIHLEWMGDSDGVAALFPRKANANCPQHLGVRVYRHGDGKTPGWAEWTLPDQVEIARQDLLRRPDWTPDSMRLIGVEPRGVVLIEPAPRFRGQVALIAPASSVWPQVRPGARPLATTANGGLRMAELLMEQGDLDAAQKTLAKDGKAGGPDVNKLQTRLKKLLEVRQRRAQELQLDVRDLRSDKSGPPQPAKPVGKPVDDHPPAPAPAPAVDAAGVATKVNDGR